MPGANTAWGEGKARDDSRLRGMARHADLMTIKHILILVAAALLGVFSAASLFIAPPDRNPPHPSYLPEE